MKPRLHWCFFWLANFTIIQMRSTQVECVQAFGSMFTVVYVRFAIKEEKSWVASLVPFDWILKERDEEGEEIYGNYRLTEE